MKTDYTLDEEYDIANRPLTDEELAQFRPLREAMPPEFVEMVLAHQAERERKGLMKTRGKQKAPTKEVISIRLSPDVLAAFRATGKGWQTRIDDVLRQHVANL
ncbi:toxin-antitoxin system, antitoxin component [[Haemophilus] felis]|nr:toxin-antitoxin system, antitoxin component [[Haemophilus] felis]